MTTRALLRHCRIAAINGDVARVRAPDAAVGELAVIAVAGEDLSLGQVIELDHDMAVIQVFAGGLGLSTAAEVRFLGHPFQVPFSAHILGRTLRGSGEFIDGGPQLSLEPRIGIPGPCRQSTAQGSAPLHDPHRYSHDRYFQLPGRKPEDSDFFGAG